MNKLNLGQKIGVGAAALVALCCTGSAIGAAFSDDANPKPKPSATAGVNQFADTRTEPATTPTTAPASTTAPAKKPTPKPSTTTRPPTRTPTPAKTTKPPTRKPTPKATTPAVQQGVHPGSFCSTQGARGVSKTGKPMVCTTTPEDPKKRWRAA